MNSNRMIKINNEEYKFIGNFMENPDGILIYLPRNNEKHDWLNEFFNSDLLIRSYVIFFHMIDHCWELDDTPLPLIINENKNLFDNFHLKWSDGNSLMNPLYFEDFMFGRFSDFNSDFEVLEEDYDSGSYLVKVDDVKFEIISLSSLQAETIGSGNCYIKAECFQEFSADMEKIQEIIRRNWS
jgi:hypothetical protein